MLSPTASSITLLSSLLLAVVAFATEPSAAPPKLGICYGRVADNLQPPSAVVGLLQAHNISKVRLFNPDPAALTAFRNTGIELMIGVPNENLTYLSTGGPDAASEWIQSKVLAFVPANQVRYLAVGNEVLLKDPFYTPYLVPALRNFQQALQRLGLEKNVKLSSPHAASVIQTSYPPSAGAFDHYILPVMRPMLEFLAETGAPLMVNVYPYFSYAGDPANVPLAYALSGPGTAPVQDGAITYTNMFDASVDAFVAAMEKVGFPGIPVVVTETGWPTDGGAGAAPENAEVYNDNIVERVLRGSGTPRRPDLTVEVFLFALFDENGKGGAEYEKHFGIFNLDGSKAYNISFV